MLNRWTNSYLIFILILTGILISFLSDHLVQFLFANLIYALAMFLIVLRDYQKGYRSLSRNRSIALCILIIVSIAGSGFYHFKLASDFDKFFLILSGLAKVIIFGYGWLSTVKILMQKQKITDQTIVLAITAYLFIGVIWAFIYYVVWEINPNAFKVTVQTDYQLKSWNLVTYFSLTTLTTLGYGDIIPVDKLLMLAANFEAIAGSIYLTVIVARLVSLYSITDSKNQ